MRKRVVHTANMGISGGSKCMYISSVSRSKECYCILQDRYNDNIYLNDSPNFRRSTVDIDTNEIAFRYTNSAIGPAGYILGMDLSTLDNIWLGWGFRVNFMYGPIH